MADHIRLAVQWHGDYPEAGMNSELWDTMYVIVAATRSFLLFLDMRPRWQQQIIRWCLGYKACHYLDMIRRETKDFYGYSTPRMGETDPR